MTPKEKAIELVDKMLYCYQGHLDAYTAKQCALIAVDEIFEALDEHHWQNRLIINYWNEVKHELEKL
jgi:hypothetical protein